jgi:hypothetical protein
LLHRAFPRISFGRLMKGKRTDASARRGDIGPSPQLRTNKQFARRLAIDMTSARAP